MTSNPSAQLLVQADNICKNYQSGDIAIKALKDVSFSINTSSFVAFVGPSGSGKSTLLNIMGCLDKQTSGTIKVVDTDISKLSRADSAQFRGENIGFIFQDFNLIPVLSVYENVEFPLRMVQTWSAEKRQEQVMLMLSAVGMSDQAHKRPEQISGGQKQRVAVARALVSKPKIVLADEPTANLDHDTAYRILELMKKMRDDFGTSFIFSTHDTKIMGEAENTFTLEDGKLIGDNNV